MATIRSVHCNAQGRLILLRLDGALFWQEPTETNSQVKTWQEIDTAGVDGRIVEVASRFSGYPGPLVVRTADDRLFEQYAEFRDRPGVFRWRPVELPA